MKKKTFKNNLITYVIVVVAWLLVEILRGSGNLSSLMQGLLIPLCVYSILAISLNLVVGISGELSLGHAGFMCVGAFASAFFSKCMQNVITVGSVRFILAIFVGAAFAAVFGILIGIPVLRLRGDYLAIVTLAFGEIIKNEGSVLSRNGSGWCYDLKRTAGNFRHAEGRYILYRCGIGAADAVYCIESDSFPRRARDYGDP